jgi:hypothetical protein
MNFYKTRSDLAREWSERTRQEDFGMVPYYVLGTIGDRNSVVARDLSGLRPMRGPGAAKPPTAPPPAHRPSGGSLAATGASDVLPWVAAAGIAASAVAARHNDSSPAEQ